MLAMTHAAVELVHQLKTRPGIEDDMEMRIYPREDDAAQFKVSFVTNPQPGDQVVEAEDVTLFLQEEAATRLADKVLDAHLNDKGDLAFQLRQQRA